MLLYDLIVVVAFLVDFKALFALKLDDVCLAEVTVRALCFCVVKVFLVLVVVV